MIQHIEAVLAKRKVALNRLIESEDTLRAIDQAGLVLANCFEARGHVYSCGNGGSMCDAMHFAEVVIGALSQRTVPRPRSHRNGRWRIT